MFLRIYCQKIMAALKYFYSYAKTWDHRGFRVAIDDAHDHNTNYYCNSHWSQKKVIIFSILTLGRSGGTSAWASGTSHSSSSEFTDLSQTKRSTSRSRRGSICLNPGANIQ